MNIILFDSLNRKNLLPLTYTKPAAELRVGILKIKEKWEHYFKQEISYLSEDYLKVHSEILEGCKIAFAQSLELLGKNMMESMGLKRSTK